MVGTAVIVMSIALALVAIPPVLVAIARVVAPTWVVKHVNLLL